MTNNIESERSREIPKKPAHQIALDIITEVIVYERGTTTPHITGNNPGILEACEKILTQSLIPEDELPDIAGRLNDLKSTLDPSYGKEPQLLRPINNILTAITPPVQE